MFNCSFAWIFKIQKQVISSVLCKKYLIFFMSSKILLIENNQVIVIVESYLGITHSRSFFILSYMSFISFFTNNLLDESLRFI